MTKYIYKSSSSQVTELILEKTSERPSMANSSLGFPIIIIGLIAAFTVNRKLQDRK